MLEHPPSPDEGQLYLDARYTLKCERARMKRFRKERRLSSKPSASVSPPQHPFDQDPDISESSAKLADVHAFVVADQEIVSKSNHRAQSFLSKCPPVLKKLRRDRVTLLTAVVQSWSLAQKMAATSRDHTGHSQCSLAPKVRMLAQCEAAEWNCRPATLSESHPPPFHFHSRHHPYLLQAVC